MKKFLISLNASLLIFASAFAMLTPVGAGDCEEDEVVEVEDVQEAENGHIIELPEEE